LNRRFQVAAQNTISPQTNSQIGGQLTVSSNTTILKQEVVTNDWNEMLRNLREVAAKNPEEVLKEILKWPPGEKRDEALEKVCYGVAQNDPAAALDLAQRLQLDQRPGDLMGNIVQQWAGGDLASAYDWVSQQPSGEQHDNLLARIAYIYAQSNPADAANLVMQEMDSGGTQIEAAMMVLHQWGLRDLAAATRWVETFPDGPLRERAVKELEGIQSYQQALTAGN